MTAKAQYAQIEDADHQEAFLQLNRSFYLSGEKVWFSLFLYDARTETLVQGRRFMQLSLVEKSGELLWQGNLKVEEGKAQAQFNLPSGLSTGTYALHLGFFGEEVDQFLYLKPIHVFDRLELANSKASTSSVAVMESINEGLEIEIEEKAFNTASEINFSTLLVSGSSAKVSVQVRKVSASEANINQEGALNLRSSRSLNLQKVYDHHYLQFELKRTSAALDSILPLAFVPEQHKTIGFIKSKGALFTLDATDLTAGMKSFYFNQFIYRAYIPPDLEWDYEKARYKDNLVPYFEGEMTYQWLDQKQDFSSILDQITWSKPIATAEMIAFAKQVEVRELLSASGAYPQEAIMDIAQDSLGMEPLSWRNAADYEQMDNMAEFLFEIVTGIKAWYTEKRKDIRVLNADGPYDDIPLILVNGVPTRNIEKVLDLPIANIEGVGVIKDHKSQGQYKYNQEALPYGAFAANGIIVIKLRPDVINPFQNDFNAMLSKEVYLRSEAYPDGPNFEKGGGPDLRTELIWWPSLSLDRERTNHRIQLSDIPGTYEIIVQGFNAVGGKIKARKTFEVVRSSQ